MNQSLSELVSDLDALHDQAKEADPHNVEFGPFDSVMRHVWPSISGELKFLIQILTNANRQVLPGSIDTGDAILLKLHQQQRQIETLRAALQKYMRIGRNDLHELAKEAITKADLIEKGMA